MDLDLSKINLFKLENALWIVKSEVGVPNYDFEFKRYFNYKTVYELEEEVMTVARIGAIDNYDKIYENLISQGIKLINTPGENKRASLLSGWYSQISEMTPRSKYYEKFPEVREVLKDFTFPIFIKGDRQTDRHSKRLSIAWNISDLEMIKTAYSKNKILHWQGVAIREYVNLRRVGKSKGQEVDPSFEYRFFFWKKKLVSSGRYWSGGDNYEWTYEEEKEATSKAQEVTNRLGVPFLVVDMAMTDQGEWIVIECNDGQESGYSLNSPYKMWQKIIEIEKHTPNKV